MAKANTPKKEMWYVGTRIDVLTYQKLLSAVKTNNKTPTVGAFARDAIIEKIEREERTCKTCFYAPIASQGCCGECEQGSDWTEEET